MNDNNLHKPIPKVGAAHFLFKHTEKYLSNPQKFIHESWVECGDAFQTDVVKAKVAYFIHPNQVKHIFIDNHSNYLKPQPYDLLSDIFGEGIIMVRDDTKWKKERQVVLPAFHKDYYSVFVKTMSGNIQKMLEKWETYKKDNIKFDLHEEMTKVSGQIIGETLLSSDINEHQIGEIADAFSVLNEYAFKNISSAFVIPSWIPTSSNKIYKKAKKKIDSLFDEIIHKRKKENKEYADLLHILMTSVYEDDGSFMDINQIKNELYNIYFAGYATTANALTAILVLLDKHPEYQQKLRDEINSVLKNDSLSLNHLRDLQQVMMVIKESLRLYPPVPSIGKMATEEDVVDGFLVPKGNWVILIPSLTHRHPDIWEEPELFNPDRFLKENEALRPKCSFIPFASGPRTCTGERFAYMEMQIMLALILPKFRIKLEKDTPFEVDWQLTIKPKQAVMAYL